MNQPTSETPAKLGYRWPAEWEPHGATWLSWPHNRDTWPGKFDAMAPQYAKLARAIAQYEPVHLLCGGAAVMNHAQGLVGAEPNVTLEEIPTNDAWARDHGPMFLLGSYVTKGNSGGALVDWGYNAWGSKYPPFDDDNAVPRHIAQRLDMRRFTPDMILEGGAVEGNGRGLLLTTESCLLNPNRNPTMSRDVVERYLRDFCCAKKVLWLSGADMAGDDTDGHVDQLARFVDATTIVTAIEQDRHEENYAPLQANLRQLQTMTDCDGQPLRIVPLQMPRPITYNGQRLPASYCNFYILNGAVLVPQFGDPADGLALRTLEEFFPDRAIIGLSAVDIVLGLGAFHCLTQQQPA